MYEKKTRTFSQVNGFLLVFLTDYKDYYLFLIADHYNPRLRFLSEMKPSLKFTMKYKEKIQQLKEIYFFPY